MSLSCKERYTCPHCSRHLSGLTLLAEQERSIVENALRVAADQYDADAKTAHEATEPRVAQQFEKQARETRTLLEELE